jgi:hypothetical protein
LQGIIVLIYRIIGTGLGDEVYRYLKDIPKGREKRTQALVTKTLLSPYHSAHGPFYLLSSPQKFFHGPKFPNMVFVLETISTSILSGPVPEKTWCPDFSPPFHY